MEWTDHGIIIKQRRHGEYDAIITVLTEQNGKHFGLVKAGFASKRRATIEIGQEVKLRWQARLSDQLGRFDLEPTRNLSAAYFDDSKRLKAILSCASLLDAALPEREKHADLYEDILLFLTHLDEEYWLINYVRWEMGLLAGLGYGFDLSSCAVTGAKDGLCYVSPRTGRAVSKKGAGEYVNRLLALPSFLIHEEKSVTSNDLKIGLKLTGYFLEHYVFHHQHVPPERGRFIQGI